jgi:hypothetical protein
MAENPYAAPRAEVKDVVPEMRRRPIVVWVITIFEVIGIIGGVYTAIAALSGKPVGGPEAEPYTKFLTTYDHLATLLVSAISAWATVELFRLRRRALPLLIASFVVGLVIAAYNLAFRPDYRAMFDAVGYWGLVVGWSLNIAIIGYVWWLRSKEVLQ